MSEPPENPIEALRRPPPPAGRGGSSEPSDAVAIEVGAFGGSIAVALGGSALAAVTHGGVAIAGALAAVIASYALAISAYGLLRRDAAWITRPVSITLVVLAVIIGGAAASISAIQGGTNRPSKGTASPRRAAKRSQQQSLKPAPP
jgi:hypothetical protein